MKKVHESKIHWGLLNHGKLLIQEIVAVSFLLFGKFVCFHLWTRDTVHQDKQIFVLNQSEQSCMSVNLHFYSWMNNFVYITCVYLPFMKFQVK